MAGSVTRGQRCALLIPARKYERSQDMYQVVVSRPGQLDEVEVLTELQNSAMANEFSAVAAIKNTLESRIKNLIGISATVSVLAPGAIERTQTGKSRRVIDKRVKL